MTNSPKSRPRRLSKPKRRIVVTGVQRERPDLRKLGRAAIALAQAAAEREAQATHEARATSVPPREESPRD
ncbi:hypothetical protein [Arthrobacter sp. CJ23]|uniref:hypothetical protein n=1 Tax=Arthrobacter sp. CJ23 TaxID=2972479 RepID=UPI00215CCB57|nr:hypothetical protein [Arthrobacter sp. CJ23]UVJ38063.1 hypothetical protein NVV90_12410 [Arthrobacter sp. CJ23]